MEDFIVEYHGEKYNLSEFLKNHPGGINYVKNYNNKDVSKRFDEIPHSTSALYLLNDYRTTKHLENQEDLENLVDWSKPLVNQVGNLGLKYKEWVRLPVDRELQLFTIPLLEYLTITPWYLVPIIWVPIILYYLHDGYSLYTRYTHNSFSLLLVFYVILGVMIWTLLEYIIHRWVFHRVPLGTSKTFIKFHFIIHGLHHKVPFDTKRLVFPPFPAAIVHYFLYIFFSVIFPEHCLHLVVAGIILGYVSYDMIHYYLHSGSPKEGSYWYNMKRYHNYHHFVHNDLVITVKGQSYFNDLSVAMKNRFENSPVATKIMGNFLEDTSKEIAVRLVKKLNKPVYVSFNVNVDKLTLPLIERQLFLEIKNKPEAF